MSEPLVEAINRFGFELQSLTIRPDAPCGVCAPNVYQCLMMAASGSTGRVLAGFKDALHFDTKSLEAWSRHSARLQQYTHACRGVELNSTSSVWPAARFAINEPWRQTMEDVFGATAQPVELTAMNAFIEKGTKGKFKDLLEDWDLRDVSLMLITCLYFKASWLESFSIRTTLAGEPFYPSNSTPQKCSMMQRTGRMQYKDDPNMQVCILPYKSQQSHSSGPRWKAAVVLPRHQGLTAITDIVSTFSREPAKLREALRSANAGMASPKVHLRLPRFTLKAHLDLPEALIKLGLGPAFSPSRDFAPISDAEDFMINRATHDLVIEVNEEGTEVGTASVGLAKCPEAIEVMECNRPFLFLIFDDVKKLVLCSAVVSSMENIEQ